MARALALIVASSLIIHAPIDARAGATAPLCKGTGSKGLSPNGAASFRTIYLEQDLKFKKLNERQQSVRAALEANVHGSQPDLIALERLQREELQLRLESVKFAYAKMHSFFEALSVGDRASAVEMFYAEPNEKYENDDTVKEVAARQEATRMNLVRELCAIRPNARKLFNLRKQEVALELAYIQLTNNSTARFLFRKSAPDQIKFWRNLYVRSGSKPRTMSVTN